MKELFVFRLGEHRFGLPLERVERVFQAVEMIDLPQAPDVVLGLVNVRGKLVPVVDIRARFGLPKKPLSLTDHMVLATTSQRELLFLVDSSVGVIPCPAVMQPSELDVRSPWVEAVLRTKDGVIFIHDFERFLSLEEQGALGKALEMSAAGAGGHAPA